MDDEAYGRVVAAAGAAGQTVSDFIRDTLLKAAERQSKRD
jgi:hypothetical protein